MYWWQLSGTETDSFRVLRQSFCGEIKIICAFRNPRNPALRMYVHGHWPLFRWPVVLHSTKPIFFLEKSFFCKRGLQRRNHFFLTVKFIGCISQIIPDSNKQQEKSSNPVAHSPHCLLSASERESIHWSEWSWYHHHRRISKGWDSHQCFNQIIGRNLTLLFFLQSSWSAIWQNTVEMGKQR